MSHSVAVVLRRARLGLAAVVLTSGCSSGSDEESSSRSSFAVEGSLDTGFTLYLDGVDTSENAAGVVVQLHPSSPEITVLITEPAPSDAEFLICPTNLGHDAAIAPPSADCAGTSGDSAVAIELPGADGGSHVAFSISSEDPATIGRAEVSYQPVDGFVWVQFIRG